METMVKKKLCWNCEGEVHEHATRCAYCGAELSATSDEEGQQPSPPYDISGHDEEYTKIPDPPYMAAKENSDIEEKVTDVEWDNAIEEAHEKQDVEGAKKDRIVPLLALSLGSTLFIFGMALLFFSDNGFFTLQWNASRWPVYIILGIPSLIFGWRKLKTLDHS